MTKRKTLITPSILSANFQHLQDEVATVEPYADWIQVDVMDGHFVPNLSFGAPVLKWIETKLPVDVHLMVSNPAERIGEFAALKVQHITFHAEVTNAAERKALIKTIRDAGATAGIAINPETPLSEVLDILPEVDLLLVMTVHPGFGGQKFIAEALTKVEEARQKFPDLMIQVDGGVDNTTAPDCIAAGADNLVAGSYIFKAADRKAAISSLRP